VLRIVMLGRVTSFDSLNDYQNMTLLFSYLFRHVPQCPYIFFRKML